MDTMQGLVRFVFVLGAVCMIASPAYPHHEALFGPQSSAALSPPAFLSTQIFTTARGAGADKTQTTTTVLSAGLQPSKRIPLSLSFVVPFSIEEEVGAPTKRAVEDSLVSARCRMAMDGFARAWGLDESYVMGVGGVELPTGTMDHPFGRGTPGSIAAVMVSAEKRPFAGIAYTYLHRAGSHQGNRSNNNLFVGGGLAFTPLDDEEHGKLLSFQIGASYEETSQEEEGGVPILLSGGHGTFVHPAFVFDIGPHVQIVNLLSVPISQSWRSLNDRQRFRFSSGAIFTL
jgi:hypothetical protein